MGKKSKGGLEKRGTRNCRTWRKKLKKRRKKLLDRTRERSYHIDKKKARRRSHNRKKKTQEVGATTGSARKGPKPGTPTSAQVTKPETERTNKAHIDWGVNHEKKKKKSRGNSKKNRNGRRRAEGPGPTDVAWKNWEAKRSGRLDPDRGRPQADCNVSKGGPAPGTEGAKN